MKNNVIKLHTQTGRHYAALQRGERIRLWLVTIADTMATISIGCCTLFCMYLAYTML